MDQEKRLAAAASHVVQCHAVDILPHWEQGTPGVLCVAGPHAIPISTAVRGSDSRLVFALSIVGAPVFGCEKNTVLPPGTPKLRQSSAE